MEYGENVMTFPGTRFKFFDSLEDYAKEARNSLSGTSYASEGGSWEGESLTKACEYLEIGGYTRYEAQVNSIIEELRIEGIFSTGVPMPERHYYGSTPNIAAYLHGLPKQMNRRIRGENSSLNAPLQIYVETDTSGGISTSQIVNRGIALSAFILAMSAIRPVEMYTLTTADYDKRDGTAFIGQCVRICSGTMDTARIMYALCSNSYSRTIGDPLHRYYSRLPPHSGGMVPQERHVEILRNNYNIDPQAIVFCGLHLFNEIAKTTPVQWVRDMVEKHKYLEAAE